MFWNTTTNWYLWTNIGCFRNIQWHFDLKAQKTLNGFQQKQSAIANGRGKYILRNYCLEVFPLAFLLYVTNSFSCFLLSFSLSLSRSLALVLSRIFSFRSFTSSNASEANIFNTVFVLFCSFHVSLHRESGSKWSKKMMLIFRHAMYAKHQNPMVGNMGLCLNLLKYI